LIESHGSDPCEKTAGDSGVDANGDALVRHHGAVERDAGLDVA
jgi:hypothetical protein